MGKTTVRGAQIADGANGVDLTVDVTGVLPIANGGTGSSTQNFVDLTTAQSIGGAKTMTASAFRVGAGSGVEFIYINGGASSVSACMMQSGGSNRWIFGKNNDTESGSNAGASFTLIAYDDSGSQIGSVFNVLRATQVLDFTQPPTVGGVGIPTNARSISAGTGLSGGGNLSADRTLSLANTAVSAGSYGSATQVGTYTVDAQGRLTAAANVTITPAWSNITSKPTTVSGISLTDLTSGVYTPTAAGVANVASVTPGQFHYIRVGNEVSFSGYVTIDPTAASKITTATLTLPIASTLGSTTEDAAGTATPSGATGVYGFVRSDGAGKLFVQVVTNTNAAQTWRVTGHYTIN